jgi:plastocyanin
MRVGATAGTVGVLALAAAAWFALPAQAATRDVHVGSFYFEDASKGDGRVVVDQGDRITFTWDEPAPPHTATVDGMFDSGERVTPQTYTTSPLTKAGTYTLYCRVHGPERHHASLVVTGKGSAAPTASPSTRPSPSPSRITSPPASPKPSPVASPHRTLSPTPIRSTATAPSASSPTAVRVIPAPGSSPTASVAALPSATDSAEPVAAEVPRTVADQDDDTNLLLPAVLALLLMVGALTATGLALRRRRP